MAPTEYAMRIIELVGCIPVIAERQPKGANSVHEVVRNNMNSCDAILVIATADQENSDKKAPSSGVSEELGILKNDDKLKNKYFVIIEKDVTLSAMNSVARYSFTKENLAPIAEAILVELGSMGLFKNYYEMPGSEMQVHTLMESIASLRSILKNGHINQEQFKGSVDEILKSFTEKITIIA